MQSKSFAAWAWARNPPTIAAWAPPGGLLVGALQGCYESLWGLRFTECNLGTLNRWGFGGRRFLVLSSFGPCRVEGLASGLKPLGFRV